MWSAVCEKAHAECQRFYHGARCALCVTCCVCDRDWLIEFLYGLWPGRPFIRLIFLCGLGHEFSETGIYYEFSETETRQACCVGWSYKIVTKINISTFILEVKFSSSGIFGEWMKGLNNLSQRAGQRGGSPANKMTFQSKQQNNTAPLKPFLSLW